MIFLIPALLPPGRLTKARRTEGHWVYAVSQVGNRLPALFDIRYVPLYNFCAVAVDRGDAYKVPQRGRACFLQGQALAAHLDFPGV